MYLVRGPEAIKYIKKKLNKKRIYQDMSNDIYEIGIVDSQGKTKRCRYTENPDEVLPTMEHGFVMEDTVTENMSQPVLRTQPAQPT